MAVKVGTKLAMGMVLVLGAGCAADVGSDDTQDAIGDTPAVTTRHEQKDPSGSDGLAIHTASDRVLTGALTAEQGAEVRFAVREISRTAYHLDVFVGDAHLEVEADTDAMSLYSNGHGAVLSLSERAALKQTSESLLRQLGNEKLELSSFAEHLLVQNLAFWAEVPEGHAIGERLFDPSQKSVGNNGITCLTKWAWYQSDYDNAAGAVTSYSVQVASDWGTSACGSGDYNCMGRCGAGCGWGAPSSWTLDCLEHDACSHDLCASGGSGDANCGDEYNEAQDDWTFGVIWGCSG